MKITSKGQVTIPQEIRERCGLLPGTKVKLALAGNTVRVVKEEGPQERGRNLGAHLRGRATVRMTTDEILALTRRR